MGDPFATSGWDDQSLTSLLAKARSGNDVARGRLMAALKRYLDFVAHRQFDQRLQAKMGPSDIVQQSMMRAIDHLDEFQGQSIQDFRGWLRQILINEARQMKRDLRAQKRDVGREQSLADSWSGKFQPELLDSLPTPSTRAAEEEQQAEIQHALACLSDEQRQIIVWRSWDGLSLDTISQRLGVSVSTASRRWYQALVAFKERLKHGQSEN